MIDAKWGKEEGGRRGSKEATWVPVPRPHDTRAEHAGGKHNQFIRAGVFRFERKRRERHVWRRSEMIGKGR